MSGGAAAQRAPAAPTLATAANPERRNRPRHEIGWAALFVFALTLAALGPELFTSSDRVLSNEDADLAMQFVHWRAFGFGEMRAGHFPLWNPHIFSGTPFFGGFQSALLYPPNWLYLVLPLARAINIGIALHVFLAGFFMYLWARQRMLRPQACAFAAVLFMFCGPHFPHIDGGHLPNLCAIVWGPLLFLAIDRWLERRSAGAVLLGGGAVAMQILAGHPQYVFYTGIVAGVYCLLALPSARGPWHAAVGLAFIPSIAVGLSAVQLLEGFHAAGEFLRSRGISFVFASLYSFAPENFLTMLAPGFFGSVTENSYWGRCSFCEMSLFFGVTGLVFAIYGAVRARERDRFRLLTVAGIALVLALGAHTPLFFWLYRHVPGFNKFRGLSKFIYPAILFLILLAAMGLDSLLLTGVPAFGLAAGCAGAALVVAVVGWLLLPSAAHGPGFIGHWVQSIYASGEVLLPRHLAGTSAFQMRVAHAAAASVFLAAATLLALGVLLFAARKWPGARAGILFLACVEMLLFARSTIETFSLEDAQNSPATDYLADHPAPAGSRILNLENANIAMSVGARDLWGYDPGVVRRYAEWIADTQDLDPDRLDEELAFDSVSQLYVSMLRCRYVFSQESMMARNNGELPVFAYPSEDLAPRVSLVTGVRLLHGRDAIFSAMRDPAFDPRREVVLETPPRPAPVRGDATAGTATLLAETTDSLTIEADLARPAILFITDTFCSGWTARSLLPPGAGGSGQSEYQVLPADYCLRGIPLQAGRHRLLVAYRPMAFIAGAWISASALAIYLLAVAAVWRRRLSRGARA